MKPCDVLCIGAHPDDVEIAMGGTVLKLVQSGRSVSLLDLTAGEMGTRGSAAERAAEADAAAQLLGLQQRLQLGLRDTALAVDEPSTEALVAALRRTRPTLLFAPVAEDVHPDHRAAAALAERATFFAGLANFAPGLGPPHRPRLVLRYLGNVPVEPRLVVDISAVAAQKAAVLRCYASQLQPPDRRHLTQGLDVLERAEVRDRFFGARVACAAAEPFWLNGPLPLRDLAPLMG